MVKTALWVKIALWVMALWVKMASWVTDLWATMDSWEAFHNNLVMEDLTEVFINQEDNQ